MRVEVVTTHLRNAARLSVPVRTGSLPTNAGADAGTTFQTPGYRIYADSEAKE